MRNGSAVHCMLQYDFEPPRHRGARAFDKDRDDVSEGAFV